ncbi:hypothetical protein NQ317_018656 [Molorchus minor]|uniref:Pre-rRNA-processing protein TSR2 homolog n=1 Tax=Molorchus minor TaxID=1323400 RepID=A0ABQ9IWH0_9CUCU|nr:hypothetical protein NQ317_018656 [Molorchus minor]
MEEPFTRVVQQIFNNWAALKLAVEHSMGGPDSKQTAIECMNYMVQFCLYETNVDVDSIQEALEDIMDEEFETICEDNSPKEIALVLFKFLQLFRAGDLAQCEIEYQKLPVMNTEWLRQSKTQVPHAAVVDDSSSEENNESETPMVEDGWVEVKNRRKR